MDTTTTEPSEHLAQLIQQARHLVDQIGDQPERDRASFEAGYQEAARTFLQHGIEIGYTQAEAEMAAAWKTITDAAHRSTSQPTHHDLELTRTEPGNLWRHTHDNTTEPDPYTAAYLRRGNREYTGGPIDYHTGKPLNPPTDPWATLPADTEARG